MEQKKAWFKLDNAAKIYPPAVTRDWMAMFRLAVTLDCKIEEDILRQALASTLKRMPTFGCRLRSGLFWYYLDPIDGLPPLVPDVRNPLGAIRMRDNNDFLFRIRYHENRIAVEFFHTVTDGTGGLTFIMTLAAEYLRLAKGIEIPAGHLVFDCNQEYSEAETEDSFLKYARSQTNSRSEKVPYHIPGSEVPMNQLLMICGTVETDKLKALAHKYHASVGNFCAALLLYAVYLQQQTNPSAKKRAQAVKISVPVNLRRYYPSKTVRNFSSYVNSGVESRLGTFTFEEVLNQVTHTMGLRLTEKQLNATFSENVSAEKIWIVRGMPLFIKKFVLKAAYLLQGDRYISTTISNLGSVDIPDALAQHVKAVDFMLGRPIDRRSVCAVISYQNRTIFTFSRTCRESEVERYFFTQLVKMGVPVRIESNGRS